MFYVTEVLGHVDYILNTNGLVELGFIKNIFPTLDSGHYEIPYIITINNTQIIKNRLKKQTLLLSFLINVNIFWALLLNT